MSINNVTTLANTGAWDGFLTHESGRFDAGVVSLNAELEEALTALANDPSNPELLAKYQSRLSEYTLYRTAQSNVVKVYKDTSSTIASNLR